MRQQFQKYILMNLIVKNVKRKIFCTLCVSGEERRIAVLIILISVYGMFIQFKF